MYQQSITNFRPLIFSLFHPQINPLFSMIRWLVGDTSTACVVGKFSTDVNDDVHNVDKLPQPVVLGNGAPDWTICDRDNQVRFRGVVNGGGSSWLLVEETEGASSDETEYVVRPVGDWVNFNLVSRAERNALDLEESEKQMKDARLNARQEFNEYLKLKSKKAAEKGIAVPQEADSLEAQDGGKRTIKLMRRKVLKKLRGADGDDVEVADSAVAFQGADRDIEGEWEGNEAFSDDDEQLFEDEINANAELNIDVDDDDVVKNKEAVLDEEDDESSGIDALFKDALGEDISKLMQSEKTKEKVTDEDLDAELKQFEGDMVDEEETEEVSQQASASRKSTNGEGSSTSAPVMVARKVTKEEQIRARIKGMFWRNEYKLKLKDILAQFPGLNRGSEEYQFLTKALKDLAEVKDGVLHLKQQHRK